ncbi:hypothetical protein SARC_06158 [Sphaeroforma arctica JP610]|uniref:Uncharacterized protein n=1 Tax=Sphaeroforma arctica JP610 TaxID=667725 RepID=A0A0L0FY91_9EUKA|nr:hypothetical protein SARC_06158 [Sphaeroforma arctica JP610]KNC81531.1 hypothetical protein SARC_06158 [Sphaeroforma arctica JP610]|eukprot:XP_014155433.1 hypothetical protein SARC_06158 [Sphaeroforma arctica JP610]
MADSDGGGAIQTTFASVSKRNAGNHDDEADIPLVAEFIDEGAIKGTDLKLWKSGM